jgi:hypothetical protein
MVEGPGGAHSLGVPEHRVAGHRSGNA